MLRNVIFLMCLARIFRFTNLQAVKNIANLLQNITKYLFGRILIFKFVNVQFKKTL